MPREIIFGEIKGIQEGQWFQGRKEMMPSSFHRNWAHGIDGNSSLGTAAIVLSGGYEDDKDLGDEIIYTGAGGNDANSRKQIADQTWTNRGNSGLLKSMNEGLPVRVIRGHLLGVESGQLKVHLRHKIEKDNLVYHRECHEYN